jgi:hypothetical protein
VVEMGVFCFLAEFRDFPPPLPPEHLNFLKNSVSIKSTFKSQPEISDPNFFNFTVFFG